MSIELSKEILEEHFASFEVIRNMSNADKASFFATKFLSFNKKNALNILLMCKVIYDLKGKSIFEDFLKLIKVQNDEKSSQFRKYVVIGKNFDKLLKYLDVLPSTWSTIYKIAEYKPEVLENLKLAGYLHSTTTANQIDTYLFQTAKLSTSKQKSDFNRIRIAIPTSLTQKDLCELIQILENLKKREWIEFELPETMQINASGSNDSNISLTQVA